MRFPVLSFLLFTACSVSDEVFDPLPWVDPMIGTGAVESVEATALWGRTDKGQCVPAVLVPHGMTCWTPQTEVTEKKGTAPYYYSKSQLQGFRASHWISGSMTQDYGSFSILPQSEVDSVCHGIRFSHADEVSTPAYYSVPLEELGILAEMTATCRCGVLRFTYREAGDVWLAVRPNSDEGQGRVSVDKAAGTVEAANPVHRIYQGKGQYAGFDGHLVLMVNKPLLDAEVRDMTAWLKYHVEAGETIEVRAATSFTSLAAARNNYQTEIEGKSFEALRRNLEQAWRDRLGRIEVKGDSAEMLKSFYTALYHASFLPRVCNDCDGSYSGFAASGLQHTESTYYDDFSMWDTYRALHPLLCLLDPQMEGEMVQSLLEKYKQGGWLPIFPCWNSYTSEMIGDHTASLVADAWFKGIHNFEDSVAAKALLQNAFQQPSTYADYEEGKGRRALDSYLKYGYIPLEDPVSEAYHKAEQTSRTLEYAYDDYVLSRFVRELGYTTEADDLLQRSQNFRHLFNPALGWVDGRHADGSWAGGDVFSFQKYICEGKPCHYSWYVPHDVPQLIRLMGGKEAFEAKLDTLFDGGYYWHGNEPCHQIAFLYNYIGKPEKTWLRVQHILQNEYAATSDGLAGNDDAGQMSAWYVFASMGLYPVCPGEPEYVLFAPSFDEVTLHLDGGRDFTIEVRRTGESAVTLNGKPYDGHFLRHSDLVCGGVLSFKF